MSIVITKKFVDENAMQAFAAQLAPCLVDGCYLYLSGELGVGKTTFARSLLRNLGYEGKVKSPTYTLVEPYQIENLEIFHFDLYRVQNENELRFIGIEEYFTPNSICFIEWPEKALTVLPSADLYAHFSIDEDKRNLILTSESIRGQQILAALQMIV